MKYSHSNFQAEIDKHVDEYGGKIVDVSKDTYTVEVVGKSQRVSDFLEIPFIIFKSASLS
jgi:acetolactate synthase-1/3 small subunit